MSIFTCYVKNMNIDACNAQTISVVACHVQAISVYASYIHTANPLSVRIMDLKVSVEKVIQG